MVEYKRDGSLPSMLGCLTCGVLVFDEELHTLAHEKNEVVAEPVEVIPAPPRPSAPQFPVMPHPAGPTTGM